MYFTQTQNKIQLEFYKLMNFLLYFDSSASVRMEISSYIGVFLIFYIGVAASIFCMGSKSQYLTRYTNESKKKS